MARLTRSIGARRNNENAALVPASELPSADEHRIHLRFLRPWQAKLGLGILSILVLVAIFAPILSPYNPQVMSFARVAPVSPSHPLGTTAYGQDILSQVIWGSRQSLIVGFAGGLGATVIALLFGLAAAYAGGLVDHTLSFVIDIFLVIPGLPLMIVVTAYIPEGATWTLIAVIVATGWAFGARQLRAQSLSVRAREFVQAARARGEHAVAIATREIVPTMIPLLVATFLSASIYSLLAAAGLQFLGLGNVNSISWGTMLYWAQNNEAFDSGGAWWAIAPGACVGLLGAALAFVNYGVDEIANPALQK
jgi:peptide/nickel transport system permease protein